MRSDLPDPNDPEGEGGTAVSRRRRPRRLPRSLPAGLRPIQVQKLTAALLLDMSEDSLMRIPFDELPWYLGGPGDRFRFYLMADLDGFVERRRTAAIDAAGADPHSFLRLHAEPKLRASNG